MRARVAPQVGRNPNLCCKHPDLADQLVAAHQAHPAGIASQLHLELKFGVELDLLDPDTCIARLRDERLYNLRRAIERLSPERDQQRIGQSWLPQDARHAKRNLVRPCHRLLFPRELPPGTGCGREGWRGLALALADYQRLMGGSRGLSLDV
jgi:hypothetical protein